MKPVKITVDVTVPSRFGPHRISLVDHVRKYVTTADVSIEMVDGKPEFIDLDIAPGHDVADRSSPTITPADLASVDWDKAARDAVFIEAFGEVFDDDALTPDEQVRRLQAVDKELEESRRYNRLTIEQLEEVASLWHQGGAQAVATRFCVSRRQADRYVSRARQEGAL